MRFIIIATMAAVAIAGCGLAHVTAGGASHAWRVAYDGYGSVRASGTGGTDHFTLRPAAPKSASSTHAALVLSRRSWRDFTFETRLRTYLQLRKPHPNDWEVGWILWHYTDDQHFYYVILKPGGWELGKEDPRYPGHQRFLTDGTRPVFPLGQWYTVRVRQSGDVISVSVNGRRLVRFADTQDPYRSGHLGLYSEDAAAAFQPVAVQPAK